MVGIGFFAPLPLAVMIPFMAAQSAVMGEAFGKHYQYGKRKISSMTNEEFNKLDGGDIFGSIITDYKKIIPQIEEAMRASKEFQSTVIQEISAIVRSLPQDVLSGLLNTGGSEQPTPKSQLGNIPLTAGSNLVSGGAYIQLQNLLIQQSNQQNQSIKDQQDFFKQWQKSLNVPANQFIQQGTTKTTIPPLTYYEALKGKSIDPQAAAQQQLQKGLAGAKAFASKIKAPTSQIKIFQKYQAQLKAITTKINSPQYAAFKYQSLRASWNREYTRVAKLANAMAAKYHSLF